MNRKCILTEKERTRPAQEKIAPSSSKAPAQRPVKLRETGPPPGTLTKQRQKNLRFKNLIGLPTALVRREDGVKDEK